MKIRLLAIALFFLQSFSLLANNGEIARIDPAFWWTGMSNPNLELLVYNPGIGNSTVTCNYKGVKVTKVEKADNPDYLYVYLEITSQAKPGQCPLVFATGRNAITYNYELKQRKANPLGINTADVMYLIMPDRFANGDISNDIAPMNEVVLDRKEMFKRHGGDLQGIIDHLEYLSDLGVNSLWLTPVFENNQPEWSYHGYAFTDHYKVDARLGGMDAYLKFTKACHTQKMKVVKDIVFNHVGNEHYLFKNKPSEDFFNRWDVFTKTNYRDGTLFDPYASDYDKSRMMNGWFDKHMPDWNQRNTHVANYLIQNAIWWVEYTGVDAYRIDTYAYCDQEFMSRMVTALLKEYPTLGIFAETWVHGTTNQAFFAKNHNTGYPVHSTLPGVTDFQVAFGIHEALNNEQGWTEGIARLYHVLTRDVVYQDPYKNVTFLDNHDLSRIYSIVGENFDKYKQAIAMLMTLRGMPCLYYGTEILMKNYSDPDGKVREDFPGGWADDKESKFRVTERTEKERAAYNYVRALANYRHKTTAMQNGKMKQFVPEKGVFVYFRYDAQKTVMVVINASKEAHDLDLNRFVECTKNFTSGTEVTGGAELTDLKNTKWTLAPNFAGVYELK